MNNNPRFIKKRLCQLVAAGLLLGAGSSVYANDFYLSSDQFTVKNNGVTIATATLGSDGVLDATETAGGRLPRIDVDDDSLVAESALPSFEFTINGDGLSASTTNTFKIGLSIVDESSPTTRRFEAYIGELTLAVAENGTTVTGTIPDQAMNVLARKGSATFYQAIPNDVDNGPFTISGGTLSFIGQEAVDVLRLQGNAALNLVLDDFTLNGVFTFRIVIEETTSGGARVGAKPGSTFTAIPRISASCALDSASTISNVFKLTGDAGFSIADQFTNPYVVQGRFSSNQDAANTAATAFTEDCVESGGSGSPAEEVAAPEEEVEEVTPPVEEVTPPAEESVEAAEEAVDELSSVLDELDTDAPLDESTLEQLDNLNTALETAAEALDTQVDEEIESGTLSEATVASSSNLATRSASATTAIANAIASGSTVSKTNLLGALNSGAKTAASASKVGGVTTDTAAKTTLNTQNKTILTNSTKLLTTLSEQSEELSTAETDAVRTVATNLVSTTTSLASESTTEAELETFASQANTILEAQEKLGIPANTALIESVAEASEAIATNLITQQLTTEGEAPSDTEIQEALASNSTLLESVLDVAIKVPPSVIIPRTERSDRISARGPSLAAAALESVTAATEKIINPANVTLKGGSTASNALSTFLGQGLLTSALLETSNVPFRRTALALGGETSIVVDEATGAVTINVPGGSYSAAIVSIRNVPAVVPQGIKVRSDGRATIVTSGAAIDLAPNAFGLVEFIAAVDAAGFAYTQNANGSFALDLGNGQTFSGVFGYDNLIDADLTAACNAISVTEPAGAENSPSYAYGIGCSNGANQRVLPFAAYSDFYASLKASGMTATTDRSTGVIGISGLGSFKPSFFTSSDWTNAERLNWLFYKDKYGIYMAQADVNGDGITDIKVITEGSTG
jgi:hypothetical protein